jgi:ribosomal protein S18 acetylase RimI-like enzyme
MIGSCSVTGRSSSGTNAIEGPAAAPAVEPTPMKAQADAKRKTALLENHERMQNGTSEPLLEFRRMASVDRHEAFDVLLELLLGDDHYRASSAAYGGGQNGREDVEAALARALSLFIDRPDYGFVWLAFENGSVVGAAVLGYGISVSIGALAANLECLIVTERERGRGIGPVDEERERGIGGELLDSLAVELRRIEIERLDVTVHVENAGAQRFYREYGFVPTHEERMAFLL